MSLSVLYMMSALGLAQQAETVKVDCMTHDRPSIQVAKAPFQTALSDSGAGADRAQLVLVSANALDTVKGQFRIYLDFTQKSGVFDTMLVYTKGTSFKFKGGELAAGSAALFDSYTYEKLGDVSVDTAEPLKIKFYAGSIANSTTKPTLLIANFVNTSTLTDTLPEGVTRYLPQYLWESTSAKDRMLPPNRFRSGVAMPPPEAAKGYGVSDRQFFQLLEDVPSPIDSQQVKPPEQVHKSPRRTSTPPLDEPLPIDFGFGFSGDNFGFQPIPIPLPFGTIPIDLNGDGDIDYILPGHDIIPGTTTMIGYINVDDEAIMIVAGEDLDGNGRLDREEIIDIVGKCIYGTAQHGAEIVFVEATGRVELRWSVRDKGGSGGYIDYFYDPVSGNLRVYQQPPGEWIYPVPYSNYGGPANDYPG